MLLFLIVCLIVYVDLFVRSWVEIPHTFQVVTCKYRRPLREVVSWNCHLSSPPLIFQPSTSSWGRELKFLPENISVHPVPVDLFVRSWVEILSTSRTFPASHVDLFVRSWVEMSQHWSTRSWNHSRPLREVVSWNIYVISSRISSRLSTSSWGRELKYFLNYSILFSVKVDLFVRSWVEIIRSYMMISIRHRRPLREVVSWNFWYPEVLESDIRRPLREVVSWNTNRLIKKIFHLCRPLREVVSWNFKISELFAKQIRSTSSWGRELKCVNGRIESAGYSRPLREVVSWNEIIWYIWYN